MATNKEAGDRLGKLIFGGIATIVGLIAIALFVANYGEDERNPLTNCRLEKKGGAALRPVGQTAILIDQSEAISEAHKVLIRQYVARLLADELKQDERVLLFTFNWMEFGSILPKVEVCKPKESANELIEAKWNIGVKLLQLFYVPLLGALSPALDDVVGRESPILEAIQAVTPHVRPWKEGKQLVIISDLLQHRPPYTHYRKLPGNEFSLLLQSRGQLAALANLKEWTVKVLYISRRDEKGSPLPYQDANHLKFWHEYFQASGVRLVTMERL